MAHAAIFPRLPLVASCFADMPSQRSPQAVAGCPPAVFVFFPNRRLALACVSRSSARLGGDLDPGRIAPQPQRIIPNVASGVDVRIGCVPAGDAAERVPVRPAVRVDLAAGIAALAGVPRVYVIDPHTSTLRLVADERPQLPKAPMLRCARCDFRTVVRLRICVNSSNAIARFVSLAFATSCFAMRWFVFF